MFKSLDPDLLPVETLHEILETKPASIYLFKVTMETPDHCMQFIQN